MQMPSEIVRNLSCLIAIESNAALLEKIALNLSWNPAESNVHETKLDLIQRI